MACCYDERVCIKCGRVTLAIHVQTEGTRYGVRVCVLRNRHATVVCCFILLKTVNVNIDLQPDKQRRRYPGNC